MRWSLIDKLAGLLTTEQLSTSEATLNRVAEQQERLVIDNEMTNHEIDMALAKSDADLQRRERRGRMDCASRVRRAHQRD